VTHIDYGVCFGRGASLRVPELVPCRLTPLLVGGLGPTAVEGRFRVACELTLGVLRRDASLLLGKRPHAYAHASSFDFHVPFLLTQ
jgi:PI-3-kinase-related kinase SMG-1